MKKILLTLVLLVGVVFGLFAQKLTYQAVVRDNNQQLVVNTAVKATVTIAFSTGNPYTTEVNGSTNIHGLLSFEFGGDALNGRDWTNATIAVKVVKANDESTVYVNDGARPVSAVPYALSVNGQSIQNYLTEHNYVDLDKLKDTLNAYPTTAVMDGRQYLTSDSAVITTMQGHISENANSIDNLIRHTAKAALRDSVAGQIHDSISNIAAKAHTHDNADILNNTTATYTAADSIKLKGIADGAEVNVQSDWSQADNSKDDFINNKPSIKDTVNNILNTGGYVTETTLDGRHYLTSDSAVITTMQGNITTNTTNIATNAADIAALANRMSTFNTNVCDSVKNCDFSDNTSIQNLLQQLEERLSGKIDFLASLVDSLSNLPHGGGDVPATFTCGTDSIKDVDNNWYHTVKIGNQCWTKENMKTTKYADDTSIENSKMFNPNDNEAYVATYGKLYTWSAATRDSSTTYPTSGNKVRGICPAGWHVPSNAEWDTLTTYVNIVANGYRCNGDGNIANALSAPTGWQSPSECAAGHSSATLNNTGFAAVPAGFCIDRDFDDFGDRAYFWSATQAQDDVTTAWYRGLHRFVSNVIWNSEGKSNGYSVRCLRDAGVGAGTTPSAPATMSCEQVMECMGDTLGKLNTKIEAQGQTITTQGHTIDSLAHLVDSLSNLPHGGGDVPATFTCGTDSIKDVDNNWYHTVKIGNQCWTKENMKTTKYADDTSIENSKMFNPGNSESNVATYGKLYTWSAATRDSSTTYPTSGNKVRGICPAGWHVPSDAEWDTLTKYVYNSAEPDYKCSGCRSTGWNPSTPCIAKALSQPTGWNSSTSEGCNAGNKGDKANATGFAAVPAGGCFGGHFNDFGTAAYFWGATQIEDNFAWYRRLDSYDVGVRSDGYGKDNGFSVRCLRD